MRVLQSWVVRGGAVAAVVALAGVGTTAAHAVQGVVADGEVAAATVRLDIAGNPQAKPGSRREVSCSGALLAQRWVISAASCFADPEGGAASAGAPSWPTEATVGGVDLTGSESAVVAVDRIVPHPERDVVLVHLASPVTGVAPVQLATAAPEVGEELTVIGFGRTAEQVVPDTAHAATYAVGAVGSGTLTIAPAQGDAAICKGDAGGPALRTTVAGAVELVAIHHTAYQGGCLGATGTRRDATETRVDDLKPWIDQTTAPKPGEAEFNEAYVAALYRDVLQREATSTILAHWTSKLDHGETLRDVTYGIVDSVSWRRIFITDQYRLLLGREPSVAKRDELVAWFDEGADTFAVTRRLVGSTEYRARAGSTDTGVIQALYRDLLGRETQPSELTFWRARIATHGRAAMLDDVVYSEEHVNRVVDQLYRQMLGRSPDAAHLRTFADVLRNGGTVQELLARLAVTNEYRNGRVRAL